MHMMYRVMTRPECALPTKLRQLPNASALIAEFKNQTITIWLARKEILTNFQSHKTWYGCGRGGVKLSRRYLLFACSKIWINTQRAAWGQNSVLVGKRISYIIFVQMCFQLTIATLLNQFRQTRGHLYDIICLFT